MTVMVQILITTIQVILVLNILTLGPHPFSQPGYFGTDITSFCICNTPSLWAALELLPLVFFFTAQRGRDPEQNSVDNFLQWCFFY